MESAYRHGKRTTERRYVPGVLNGLRIRDSPCHLLSGGEKKAVVGKRINPPVVMASLYPDQGPVKDIILFMEKGGGICRDNRQAKLGCQVYRPFHERKNSSRRSRPRIVRDTVILENHKEPLRVVQNLFQLQKRYPGSVFSPLFK
jgi:hypothetical protein